jgi:hypothetical protein
MPEKETILQKIDSLTTVVASPVIAGKTYSEDQIWEGNELGANFKLIKEKLFPEAPAIYKLNVSGDENGAKKIISDIENIFGKPLIKGLGPISPETRYVLWNAEAAEKNRHR